MEPGLTNEELRLELNRSLLPNPTIHRPCTTKKKSISDCKLSKLNCSKSIVYFRSNLVHTTVNISGGVLTSYEGLCLQLREKKNPDKDTRDVLNNKTKADE